MFLAKGCSLCKYRLAGSDGLFGGLGNSHGGCGYDGLIGSALVFLSQILASVLKRVETNRLPPIYVPISLFPATRRHETDILYIRYTGVLMAIT